jgi:leucyl aminopeptidase
MIVALPPMVKDPAVPATKSSTSPLLPGARRPALAPSRPRLTHALLDDLEAVLAFVPATGAADCLAKLPFGALLVERMNRRPRKAGDSFSVALPTRSQAVVSIGLVADEATPFALLDLAGSMVRRLRLDETRDLGVVATGLVAARERACVEAGIAAAWAGAFPLPRYKSGPAPAQRFAKIVPVTRQSIDSRRLAAVAEAGDLVRWLTALPPDRLDPAGFRRAAQALARRHGLQTRFYGEAELRRLGAGAFLAVTRGSPRRNAGILHLRYRPRGARRGQPVALVGKGLCFDTGGTNLKSHKSMLDMHTDMSGSAVALASIVALSQMRYPRPVDAWLALAENRIGPEAYQPQDVVTAMNGTTIQVIHTDAEGRMVLADTLALASRSKPAAVIDFATLTGACVGALTERYSGAFTSHPGWRTAIEGAGRDSGERVWVMPMDDDFDRELKSKVADIVQCTVEGKGDHIYAARFLRKFVGEGIPWLHVDLSAATRGGGLAHVPTDVTGFGVRFLASLLLDHPLPDGKPAP